MKIFSDIIVHSQDKPSSRPARPIEASLRPKRPISDKTVLSPKSKVPLTADQIRERAGQLKNRESGQSTKPKKALISDSHIKPLYEAHIGHIPAQVQGKSQAAASKAQGPSKELIATNGNDPTKLETREKLKAALNLDFVKFSDNERSILTQIIKSG